MLGFMTNPRRSAAALLLVVLAAALAGCDAYAAPSEPAATAVGSSPTTPSSSPTAEPVTLPTECADLVAPEVYAVTFFDTPLNDPLIAADYPLGSLAPTPPADGATPGETVASATELRCLWRDPAADVTYLQVELARVAAATSTAYLGSLPGDGYTCADVDNGFRCQIVGTSPLYPVEEATTVYVRDDVVITISQANFPTTNLLGEITGGIW